MPVVVIDGLLILLVVLLVARNVHTAKRFKLNFREAWRIKRNRSAVLVSKLVCAIWKHHPRYPPEKEFNLGYKR